MLSYLSIECGGSISQIVEIAGQITPTLRDWAGQLLWRFKSITYYGPIIPFEVEFKADAAEVLTGMARNRGQSRVDVVWDALELYRQINVARKYLREKESGSLAGDALTIINPRDQRPARVLYYFGEIIKTPPISSRHPSITLQFGSESYEWLGYIAESENTTRVGIIQRAVALERALDQERRFQPASRLALVDANQNPLKSWNV